MPRRKRSQPYRVGYKTEFPYPSRRCLLAPEHGSVPRCRVDYNPGVDGPWTMLRIMSLEENNGHAEEEYTCAIPRYYAIPLILINKRLAFYEAQCYSNGEPRLLLTDRSPSVKQRELREYTYLWRLRCKFLQSVFDMNHERRLDENWKCDHIHGYLHRMYKRYGHDAYQRLAYWRDELKEGRVPYSAPDIADMAHIKEDMTCSTRLDAFVWNRISQGYSRVVKDDPRTHEQWQAWRRGDRDLKALTYRTPSTSPDAAAAALPVPVPELSNGEEETSEMIEEGREEQGCRRDVDHDDDTTLVVVSTTTTTAAAAAASIRAPGDVTAPPVRGAQSTNEDEENILRYENALSTVLVEPLHFRRTCLPEWSCEMSQVASTQASTSETTTTTTTSVRKRQLLVNFDINAPEDMQLTVIRCTFSRLEDVGVDFKTKIEVDYASKR
ncbi:hypothetical protein BGW80DRAFT_1303110 [Lactifluus volemus]|nr:hypothetical protein BGW80DRAFT_1303110 [Lactifluus volemus]